MPSKFDAMVRTLGQLNLQIKHQVEQAEAKVSRVNKLVGVLSETGLLNRITIFGERSRLRSCADDEHPSWLVVMPVLLTPEGFGVCYWDAEEGNQLNEDDLLHSEARRNFVAFDQCEPVDKAFLLPFIEPMLDELMDVASVAAGDLVPGSPMPASEYFLARKRKKN